MASAKDAFLVKEWLAADADARTANGSLARRGVSCDASGCVSQGSGGGFVALATRAEALADDCERAVLIVTARPAPQGCAAAVIDAGRLRRHGALVLRRTKDGFAIDAVKPGGVDWPWSPAVPGDGESETTLRAPRCRSRGPPSTRRRPRAIYRARTSRCPARGRSAARTGRDDIHRNRGRRRAS